MNARVSHTEIEAIVGHERHRQVHLARAVTEEQTVYILHSQHCKDSTPDLRDCRFSLALDRGIDLEKWDGMTDTPVAIFVWEGAIRPYPNSVQMRLFRGQL